MILYNILTALLYPFIYLFILYRKYTGKEDQYSFNEKLGNISVARPQGFLVWIHVASLGEYLSVKLLIDRLIKEYNVNILITTITLSAAKLIKEQPSLIHQYFPIDNNKIVNKFITHWQPNLTLWVESELWPNILNQASKINPVILINGKLSQRSYKRWLFFKYILNQILSNFVLVLPQSLNDHEKFKNICSHNLKFIGNIKYAVAISTIHNEIIAKISNIFPERKFTLIAASTHKGEELLIAKAYKRLKQKFSNIFLIIAPRHPGRIGEVTEDLKDFNISIRSRKDHIDANTEIYVVDTIGELKYFYEVSDIAFIGGSFSSIGGHNPLEAANASCAIIYGPNYTGFKEIVEELIDKKAIHIINNSSDYELIVEKLFLNNELLNRMKLNGKKLITEKSIIIDKYMYEIKNYMPISKN